MYSQDQWDARLREHGGHLLQTWAWGAFKHDIGWCPERVMVDDDHGLAMAQVLFRHKGPVSLGYIPRGPLIAGDEMELWPRLWAAIDQVARRRRAMSVIIEADCEHALAAGRKHRHLAPTPGSIQPLRTVKVPLLDDDALLAQMHQKTRYNVRLAPRRGVRFEVMTPSADTIARFYTLMRDTAARNQFAVHPESYYAGVLRAFGDDATLLGAWTKDDQLAAALIVARFGDEAVYLYGASSTVHRAHGAGLAIQFEAMKWARARGARVYDLWGIPRHDPNPVDTDDTQRPSRTCGKDWRGLFRFKTGFGGEIISYPDPVERRYLPVLPSLARRFGFIPG